MGDRTAFFRQLYDEMSPRMYGLSMRLLRRPELAEEVLQDALRASGTTPVNIMLNAVQLLTGCSPLHVIVLWMYCDDAGSNFQPIMKPLSHSLKMFFRER